MLVGNKIDLEEERKVSKEEAMALADQHKMHYFETSAKLNRNIDELMQHLMEQVYQKMFNEGAEERMKSVMITNKEHKKGKKEKKGCC